MKRSDEENISQIFVKVFRIFISSSRKSIITTKKSEATINYKFQHWNYSEKQNNVTRNKKRRHCTPQKCPKTGYLDIIIVVLKHVNFVIFTSFRMFGVVKKFKKNLMNRFCEIFVFSDPERSHPKSHLCQLWNACNKTISAKPNEQFYRKLQNSWFWAAKWPIHTIFEWNMKTVIFNPH